MRILFVFLQRARQTTEGKQEKANPIWYCSQLLKHFSYNGVGMPKYNYFIDEKTRLICCQIMLQDTRIFRSDPCTTHEQAAENAARKVYKVIINA